MSGHSLDPRPTSILDHLASLSPEEWAAMSWIRCTWSPPTVQAELDEPDELTDFAVAAAEALAARRVKAGRLSEAGPPIVDLCDGTGPRWSPPSMGGICRASTCSDPKIAGGEPVRGLWTRDGQGKPMLCMPIVHSLFSLPHDIAVFADDQRDHVWLLTGAATAQNEAEILHGEGPLVLYPDLMSWAASGGAGAVIFDLAAWAPLLLELQRPIHCVGLALASQVDKALSRARPKKPQLGVIDAPHGRAA